MATQTGGHDFFQLFVEEGPVPSHFVGAEDRDSSEVAVAIEGLELLGSESRGVLDFAGMKMQIAVHRSQLVVAGSALVGIVDLV